MPKRKKTNLTTGKKHMRMRRSHPTMMPQMNWDTEIELFDNKENMQEGETVEDEYEYDSDNGEIRNYPEEYNRLYLIPFIMFNFDNV